MYCLLRRAHLKIRKMEHNYCLITLNEHNCFITLIFLKHFLRPRKDCYIFLLNVYFVEIKNEHGNVHFNYFWFQIIFGFRTYKGKVFYGQEPPSGESTTTECGVNYQLLAVMY